MQGSPHSVLEGRCPTEFTSNLEGLNPLHQMLHIFRKLWCRIHVMQISNLWSAANKCGPEGTTCVWVCVCVCICVLPAVKHRLCAFACSETTAAAAAACVYVCVRADKTVLLFVYSSHISSLHRAVAASSRFSPFHACCLSLPAHWLLCAAPSLAHKAGLIT